MRINKIPFEKRFWEKVSLPKDKSECWLWNAYIKPSGHGQMHRGGREANAVNAHIASYEIHTGNAVPNGYVLHHKCQVKSCVNPDHLQLVTRAEHPTVHFKTHCKNGHIFDEANTYFYKSPSTNRGCRTCNRLRSRVNYQQSKKGFGGALVDN